MKWRHPEQDIVFVAVPDPEGDYMIDGKRVSIVGNADRTMQTMWVVTGEFRVDRDAIDAMGARPLPKKDTGLKVLP